MDSREWNEHEKRSLSPMRQWTIRKNRELLYARHTRNLSWGEISKEIGFSVRVRVSRWK